MNLRWRYILLINSFVLAISGCATVAHNQPDLLHSSTQPWFCEGKINVGNFGGMSVTREITAHAVVHPSKDIEDLEVDLTPAISQAKKPCANGATCKVDHIGTSTRIAIRPAEPTHPSSQQSPGMMFYSEGIQFDSTNSQFVFSGGGFEWDWNFTGKCTIKP
jgi:hypothetical protein